MYPGMSHGSPDLLIRHPIYPKHNGIAIIRGTDSRSSCLIFVIFLLWKCIIQLV